MAAERAVPPASANGYPDNFLQKLEALLPLITRPSSGYWIGAIDAGNKYQFVCVGTSQILPDDSPLWLPTEPGMAQLAMCSCLLGIYGVTNVQTNVTTNVRLPRSDQSRELR